MITTLAQFTAWLAALPNQDAPLQLGATDPHSSFPLPAKRVIFSRDRDTGFQRLTTNCMGSHFTVEFMDTLDARQTFQPKQPSVDSRIP